MNAIIPNGESFLCFSYAPGRRLVDDRPECAELFDGLDKLLEIDRLHHVGVHAQFVTLHQVLFLARGGEDDQWDRLQFVVLLDGAQHRSEEHTSELQSRLHLVCRLLLEKKNLWSIFIPFARVRSFPTRSITTSEPRFPLMSITCFTGSRRASTTRWAPIFSASRSLLSATSAAIITALVMQRSS